VCWRYARPGREVGEQHAKQVAELAALRRRQSGDQALFVVEQFVDGPIQQAVAGPGQTDDDRPAVLARSLPVHQAVAFGPGDTLGDGAGADQ